MKYENSCIRQALNIWDYIIHETKKLFASQLNKSLSGAALGITEKWRHSPNPLSSSCRHGPGMKELGLVILTCSFLSLVELAEKNVKMLERSMRKHKAFCSCAQKIIYKVTIDICSRIFTKNVPGWARKPQLEAMGRIVIWDLFVREMFMAKEACWVRV